MEAPPPRPAQVRLRRGVTLADQLAASSNLRDLLKLRDDADADADGRRRQPQQQQRRRTLGDVIRDVDDRPPAPAPSSGAAATAPGERRRVSLMALLEQAAGRQWAAVAGGERKRAEEDAAAAEEGRKCGGGVGGRCCVCMARGKGAAFIPCGHTFCRACARELRGGRGRCPLCNAAIREVLNLF